MDLNKVFAKLLLEFGAPMAPAPMANPMPALNPSMPVTPMVPPPVMQPPQPPVTEEQQDDSVIILPDVNVSVSIFPAQKKLTFMGQDHGAFTQRLKFYINLFKQNFRISDIYSTGEQSFEVVFDPRESFEAVVTFLKELEAFSGGQR